MTVRYDKLWSLMKTNKMKKSELAKAAELTQYTMTKLNQDRLVSMEVMATTMGKKHLDFAIARWISNYSTQYGKAVMA